MGAGHGDLNDRNITAYFGNFPSRLKDGDYDYVLGHNVMNIKDIRQIDPASGPYLDALKGDVHFAIGAVVTYV